MRALLLLLFAGCAADPCDAFPEETCLSLEVRAGSAELASLDQLRLAATSGFLLSDGVSPASPRAFELPVQVAVLPGRDFSGAFSLLVRGFLATAERGRAEVRGAFDRPGQHLRMVATLFPHGIAPDADLAGVDLSGVDFATAPPPDLASADLRFPSGWTKTVVAGTIEAMWATSPNDIWAVGGRPAVILHSTGFDDWSPQALDGDPSFVTLDSVWASGPDDIYVVGEGKVHHSTGNETWSTITVATDTVSRPRRVFGLAANDVYVCASTDPGTPANPTGGKNVFHFTGGATWDAEMALEKRLCHAMIGFADDAFYIAGDHYTTFGTGGSNFIGHRAATGVWSTYGTGFNPMVVFLAGTSATNLYAIDRTGNTTTPKFGILRSGGDDNWGYSRMPGDERLTAVTAVLATELWAVGQASSPTRGIVLRSTGANDWDPDATLPAAFSDFALFRTGVAIRFGELYVAGENFILHRRP